MRKILSATLAAGILASLSLTPAFAFTANSLPDFNSGSNVKVDADNNNHFLNVQVQGGNNSVGTATWNSFNVGTNSHVNFEFTGHNQTALNRVLESGGLSNIFGKITNSGCADCGYQASGKVILINPNGILFGQSANVDLNSFTATTFNGSYNNKKLNDGSIEGSLALSRQPGAGNITVMGGAKIIGDKNVSFAASNIYTYADSLIKTESPDTSSNDFAKIKLVTADGVNFTYYNNGAVKNVSNDISSADKMKILVNGTIESGNIDIRNRSVNSQSDINVGGDGIAVLRATKASKGNDGNIWLTSENDITMGHANLTTENGGNIALTAGNNFSAQNSSFSTPGTVDIYAAKANAVLHNSSVEAGKNVSVFAGKIASLQNATTVHSDADVTISSDTKSQLANASVNANNLSVSAPNVWLSDANVKANNNIDINASKNDVKFSLNSAKANSLKAKNIKISAAANVYTNADNVLNLNNSKTAVYAGNNINLSLKNVSDRNNALIAEAGNNLDVKTDGTLAISRLVAKNGDLSLTADKVIAGYPKVTDDKLKTPGDSADRAYIYVLNGKFSSNTKNDEYKVTDSADPVDKSQGLFNQRHHIQYGNGNEKILLVNKRPYTQESTTPAQPILTPSLPDDSQAKMLNKLPRQPELFNNNTNISNTRTSFVDVYAAASQIEIDEDSDED